MTARHSYLSRLESFATLRSEFNVGNEYNGALSKEDHQHSKPHLELVRIEEVPHALRDCVLSAANSKRLLRLNTSRVCPRLSACKGTYDIDSVREIEVFSSEVGVGVEDTDCVRCAVSQVSEQSGPRTVDLRLAGLNSRQHVI